MQNINRFITLMNNKSSFDHYYQDSSWKSRKFTSKILDKSVESLKKSANPFIKMNRRRYYEISIALRIWRVTNVLSTILTTQDSFWKSPKFISKTIDKSVESLKKIGEFLHKESSMILRNINRFTNLTSNKPSFLPLKIPLERVENLPRKSWINPSNRQKKSVNPSIKTNATKYQSLYEFDE